MKEAISITGTYVHEQYIKGKDLVTKTVGVLRAGNFGHHVAVLPIVVKKLGK